jgi:hypothetical protein
LEGGGLGSHKGYPYKPPPGLRPSPPAPSPERGGAPGRGGNAGGHAGAPLRGPAFGAGDGRGLYFRHSDHLGSTSVLSDADGLRVEGSEVVYAPFGEIRIGEQTDLTDFKQPHPEGVGVALHWASGWTARRAG